MSKTIKNLMMRDYKDRMGSAEEAVVIGVRGLKAVDTTKVRTKLRTKQIKVTVVRNALARKMFEGSKLSSLSDMLSGASALAYCPDGGTSVVEVAREVVALAKTFPLIELKGAVLDGTVFNGKKGVEELAAFPTRIEAQGQVITLLVSPGRKVAAQIKGPGSNIAGLIKAIEAKLEKGETIAKVG
jgi:large subunit ribosomal protein L10